MTRHFTPPAPSHRAKMPGFFHSLWIASTEPLSVWPQECFHEPYFYQSFGVNSNFLVANDPDLIKYILVDRTDIFKLSRIRQLLLRPMLQNGLVTAENDSWKVMRKALSPVFKPGYINSIAEQMLDVAEKFSERYKNKNAAVDMSHEMSELAYLMLSRTLFSDKIVGDPVKFRQNFDDLIGTMGQVSPFDIVRAPAWVPRPIKALGRTSLRYFRKVVKETRLSRIAMLKRGEKPPNDFLDLLLNTSDSNELTMEEVEGNLISFIAAGHETTARALSWTIYLISKTTQEREIIEAECKNIVISDVPPAEWMNKMPYTRAALEEAMRLYPPVPAIARDMSEDTHWNGLDIEKGTEVLIMPWTIHRNALYWDNPNEFDLTRFLPQNRDKIHRFQYMPFGAGARVCIGMRFAMQEAIISLATLLSKYRFDMAEDAKEPWPIFKVTLQPQDGVEMVVSKI